MGAVLDWVLTKVAAVGAALWRQVVEAIRYAKNSIIDIMDWAVTKSGEIFAAILGAVEAAGEKLTKVFEWAVAAGDAAIDQLVVATIKIENSISYLLTWAEKDALPALARMVQAALNAGMTLVDLVSWMASRTLQAVTEAVKAIFATGVTLAQLFADTVVHPGDLAKNVVAAVNALGKGVNDVVAAAVSLGVDGWGRFLDALRDLGHSAREIVLAAYDLSASSLALVVAYVMTWFGVHRTLTAEEKDDAQKTFGSSIDLDRVLVAVVTPPVDLIELINHDRPFTTMYIINFASWATVDRKTLIHELTHVWQGVEVGPLYMVEALHAQAEFGPAAYDYGGEAALVSRRAAAASDKAAFDTYNREAEAHIIEDYWDRRFQQALPQASWQSWQPYDNVVFT